MAAGCKIGRSRLAAFLVCCAASCLPAFAAPGAETRSFVVSQSYLATYSQDGDCPDGINPRPDAMYRRILLELGKSKEEVDEIFKNGLENLPAEGRNAIINRGRLDGKAVNEYAYPAAVPDPHMHTVVARYAFGFNLDGKGAASPNGFEDPETHVQGVNNELYRALGCTQSIRAFPPERSLQGGSYQWTSASISMLAWVISITADNFEGDSAATVSFDRAMEHVSVDATSRTLADSTFRIDPDPRSRNLIQGRIQKGVFTYNAPVDFHILGDPFLAPQGPNFELRRSQLRLALKPDGTLDGFIGGYQPWLPIYWAYAASGFAESMVGIDDIGIFYALKRLADAYPNPKTGQNEMISATYRIEAIPAFAIPANADGRTAQSGR